MDLGTVLVVVTVFGVLFGALGGLFMIVAAVASRVSSSVPVVRNRFRRLPTRTVRDGFWIDTRGFRRGSSVRTVYVSHGKTITKHVRVDGSPMGTFVYTGDPPASVAVDLPLTEHVSYGGGSTSESSSHGTSAFESSSDAGTGASESWGSSSSSSTTETTSTYGSSSTSDGGSTTESSSSGGGSSTSETAPAGFDGFPSAY